jgi:hypothetical protein
MLKLIFIFRYHDDKVWDVTEIRKIKQPMVGRAILSHNPSTVQCKDYREILQANILDELVISSL